MGASSTETRKTVTNYAIAGGLTFALPLSGLDNIIYAIILWSMYASIARKAGKAFGSNVTKTSSAHSSSTSSLPQSSNLLQVSFRQPDSSSHLLLATSPLKSQEWPT